MIEWKKCEPSCICRRADCGTRACCKLPELKKNGKWSVEEHDDEVVDESKELIQSVLAQSMIQKAMEKLKLLSQ